MPDVRPENLAQVEEFLKSFATTRIDIPPHACNDACGIRCLRPLVLGMINAPKFTGDDVIWGPEAAGSLFADFDYR